MAQCVTETEYGSLRRTPKMSCYLKEVVPQVQRVCKMTLGDGRLDFLSAPAVVNRSASRRMMRRSGEMWVACPLQLGVLKAASGGEGT